MICAAGCGGGQGGSGGAAAVASQTSKAGEAVFTYSGQPKPMATTSTSQVTVFSQAGAAYSNIALQPSPNLADTYMVFSRYVDGAFQLYSLPYNSYNAQLLYQNTNGASAAAISPYGTILFNLLGGDNADTGVTDSIRPDGTGLKSVTFSNSAAIQPAFSNDGTNRVAFYGGGLWVAPGTGGTATQIQPTAFAGNAWSPSGTQIVYTVLGSGGTTTDLWVTSSTGGTPTDVTPTALKSEGFFEDPSWSADGVTIAATFHPSGSSTSEIVKFSATNPATYQVTTPSGYSDVAVSYSPDGSKMAFYRSNVGGATPGIYISDAAGLNAALVLQDPSGGLVGIGTLDWSPFLPKETVVSATASTFYHQAASGFLLSQVGSQFGSLVAFTATTPSSATVTSPTTSGAAAPLVFNITADSITQIGYINNYFNPGTTMSLTSTPSVVVTVDGSTGQVDLVAPAAKPATSRTSGLNVTYSGTFKALYDKSGKNLAPSGASEITVDPKSGKLVSFK